MLTLRPHQEEALERLHNGSILWGGVGSGKSITAVFYYKLKEAPRDVYVITTAKKRDSYDWVGEFAHIGVGCAPDATVAGVLTVDSWNNIGKYKDVKDAFFIFDEQRLVGSGHWSKTFIKIARANRWILLSATPGDTWLDYIPVFCANGFYKNRTEFKREHVVYSPYTRFPKVERYLGVNKLIRLRNSILVEMPYASHAKRHTTFVDVDYDRELFDKVVKKRWHVFESRPLRDVSELFSVMRKVVNSDESRLTAVRNLLQTHQKLIVFYNFDYELELLRTLVHGTKNQETVLGKTVSSPIVAEWNGHKHEPIPLHSVSQISVSSRGKTSPASSSTDESMHHRTSRSSSVTVSEQTPILSTSSKQKSNSLHGKNGFSTTATVVDNSRCDKLEKDQSSFAVAEWNGHKHEPIPKTDSWVYLVQYTAGSEGWNCVETDAMCFYSLTYSYKAFHQSHGRIDRMNSPFWDLYYYVLKSKSVIDIAIWRSLSVKKSFNERRFVDIWT